MVVSDGLHDVPCVEFPLLHYSLLIYVSGYFDRRKDLACMISNGWGPCAFRMLIYVGQEVGISVLLEDFDPG